MPYYNGAWLSDDEYAAVVAAAGAGDDGRGAPNTGLDPRWSQPNSGQEAIDHYGGGADRRAVQPYRPATATTTTGAGAGRPVDRGAAIVSPANSGSGIARPDNQRPGETYQQYLTRFYAAYGQQPPTQAAAPAAQPRPQSGGGSGAAPRQPAYAPSAGPATRAPVRPPTNWNEAAYLRANPDVARAVAQGVVSSGYEHYAADGMREGRGTGVMAGPTGWNDEAYLRANPDVARAVARGDYGNGFEHWWKYGRNEVREGGRGLNDFERANPNIIGVAVPAGGWKPPTPAGPTPEQQRAAQVAGIKPRIVGVDRWGAQLVGFDNVPAGMTLSNEELGRMAQNAGFGAAAVQQGWRDRGGKVGAGEAVPSAGAAPAATPRANAWDAPTTQPRNDGPQQVDDYGKGWATQNPETWGTNLPGQNNSDRWMNEKGSATTPKGGYSAPNFESSNAGQAFLNTPASSQTPQQEGYDWGNPQPSEADKVLFGEGLPPEDDEDDEEKS